jgi:hypothetical protein
MLSIVAVMIALVLFSGFYYEFVIISSKFVLTKGPLVQNSWA